MAKTNNESIIRLCIVVFASLVLTHSASANPQSQKSNGQNTRAVEMQLQQLKARENVKHKMLQDQIAAIENRLKILEEKVKDNQKEIKFLKRLSR